MEMGARDVQGLPLLTKPATGPSYIPMAGKPAPSSHEPAQQWKQAPVTLINQWNGKEGWGESGGKCTFRRLKEASGLQAYGADASTADHA